MTKVAEDRILAYVQLTPLRHCRQSGPFVMTDEQFKAMSEALEARCHTGLGPFTVMLAIVSKLDPTPAGIIANGTGSLINTGTGHFLVTNNHVYDEFRTRRAASPDIMLAMSGVDYRPFRDISHNHSVRGRDKDLDLAVLEIPVPLVVELGKMFSTWTSWPPQRPEKGMRVLVYGYPGQGRVPLSARSLGVCPLVIGRYVVSVSDRHFLLANPDDDAVTRTPDGIASLTGFGGLSGSAVYVLTSDGPPVLGGFMYESSLSMDIICAAHADHIRADGTIGGCA